MHVMWNGGGQIKYLIGNFAKLAFPTPPAQQISKARERKVRCGDVVSPAKWAISGNLNQEAALGRRGRKASVGALAQQDTGICSHTGQAAYPPPPLALLCPVAEPCPVQLHLLIASINIFEKGLKTGYFTQAGLGCNG